MPGAIDKVFIVESVAAEDLFDDRSEGEGLCRMLHLAEVKSHLQTVSSKSEFLEALSIFRNSQARALHISCHGNEEGIGFTNGSWMTWNELFTELEPFIDGRILCLSSCGAAATSRLSDLFAAVENRPFMIVGSPDEIRWLDAFVAWGIIYSMFTYDGDRPILEVVKSIGAIKLARGANMVTTVFGDVNGAVKPLSRSGDDVIELLREHGFDGMIDYVNNLAEIAINAVAEGEANVSQTT